MVKCETYCQIWKGCSTQGCHKVQKFDYVDKVANNRNIRLIRLMFSRTNCKNTLMIHWLKISGSQGPIAKTCSWFVDWRDAQFLQGTLDIMLRRTCIVEEPRKAKWDSALKVRAPDFNFSWDWFKQLEGPHNQGHGKNFIMLVKWDEPINPNNLMTFEGYLTSFAGSAALSHDRRIRHQHYSNYVSLGSPYYWNMYKTITMFYHKIPHRMTLRTWQARS